MQHDSFANDPGPFEEELRARLAERIRDGLLPGIPPMRIFAGNGSGWPCAVCDHEIPRGDVELELEFAASADDGDDGEARIFLVHHACYETWETVRRRDFRRRPAPGVDPPTAPPAGAPPHHPS